MVNYTIRSFDKLNGQILVEFENLPTFAIDLPIIDGKYPEGEDLENIIQGYAPVWLIERKQTISQNIPNESYIDSLVVPFITPVANAEQLNNLEEEQATQLENDKKFITDIVNEILAAKGL